MFASNATSAAAIPARAFFAFAVRTSNFPTMNAAANVAGPDLEENRCHRNGQHGIGYTASAGGTARENQCFANVGSGIHLDMQAAPTLEDNECSGNQGHGIGLAASVGKIRLRGN